MGQLSNFVVLGLAVALVIVLFTLAWTLGVSAVLGISRARRRMRDVSARVALLERELRSRARATDTWLVELERSMRAIDR